MLELYFQRSVILVSIIRTIIEGICPSAIILTKAHEIMVIIKGCL